LPQFTKYFWLDNHTTENVLLDFHGTAFCVFIVDSDMQVSNIRGTPCSVSMGTVVA